MMPEMEEGGLDLAALPAVAVGQDGTQGGDLEPVLRGLVDDVGVRQAQVVVRDLKILGCFGGFRPDRGRLVGGRAKW